MISLPIWLFVLLVVFGFIGVITTILFAFFIISALTTPAYNYYEEEIMENELNKNADKSN